MAITANAIGAVIGIVDEDDNDVAPNGEIPAAAADNDASVPAPGLLIAVLDNGLLFCEDVFTTEAGIKLELLSVALPIARIGVGFTG